MADRDDRRARNRWSYSDPRLRGNEPAPWIQDSPVAAARVYRRVRQAPPEAPTPRTRPQSADRISAQQVSPAARELAQRGHCRGFLGFTKRSPPGAVLGFSREAGDEQTVSLRTFLDYVFQYWRRHLPETSRLGVQLPERAATPTVQECASA